MTRLVSATFCAAALALVSVGAQTPSSSPQSPNPQTPTSAGTEAKAITATGCVRLGSDGKTYYLVNADTGMSGAVGTTGATAGQKTFKLQAGTDIDLSKHVGHKVQATGSADKAKTAGGAMGTSGDMAADAWARDAKNLQVSAIKHIADKCE